MAGELASDNAAYLRGRVGREPTSGELYVAHFLGPKGSADLIEAQQSRPAATAAALFPDAAAANPSIFYRDGRPVTVAELYANLTQGHAAAATTTASSAYLHFDGAARLARMEQERMVTDMLLGVGDGDPGQSQGGARGLSSALFSSEMLSLLSEARQTGGKG
jgi:hypothetical protein